MFAADAKFDNAEILKQLNDYLVENAFFAKGPLPNSNDVEVFHKLPKGCCYKEYPAICRFVRAMRAYSCTEMCALAKAEKSVFASEEKKEEESDEDSDDDSDFDPFASDDDSEAERAFEERAKAAQARIDAKNKNKDTTARSMIVMKVAPYDEEVDLKAIAAEIPTKICKEGCTFGAPSFEPVAFGVLNIMMPATIVDDLIDTEELCEEIVEAYEDDLQSCEVIVFNKL